MGANAQLAAGSTSSKEPLVADVIDVAPWGVPGKDGRPVGVYALVFKRLSERSGCPIETRLTPIPRAVMEVSRGVASATIMLDRKDLNDNAVELGEVADLRIEVWLPLGSPLNSLADLAGKKVGVLRGPSYHEGFDQDPRIVKHPVTNPLQQLEMLRKGRLDGAIGVRENFLLAASQMQISASAYAPPIELGKRVVKLWVTPGLRGTACAEQLAKALKDMRRDGEINRLISEAHSAPR
jgi:ABC-type amino acid transport substrate-binding protein